MTDSNIQAVNILRPIEFGGLLAGALVPYAFAALTLRAVSLTANEMIAEIQRQFLREEIKSGSTHPDYERCIEISTKASLRRMIAPGLLVIGCPILAGYLFGTAGLSGLLAGIIVSGI